MLKTWQTSLFSVRKNVNKLNFDELNYCLLAFCSPQGKCSSQTFLSKHVDSWVHHVFSLSVCTGDTQARTHAWPDVLLHILCLNRKNLPDSAPTKINSPHLWHMHLLTFSFLSPAPCTALVSQRTSEDMCKTGSRTIIFIHSVCLTECSINAAGALHSYRVSDILQVKTCPTAPFSQSNCRSLRQLHNSWWICTRPLRYNSAAWQRSEQLFGSYIPVETCTNVFAFVKTNQKTNGILPFYSHFATHLAGCYLFFWFEKDNHMLSDMTRF